VRILKANQKIILQFFFTKTG